MLQRHALGCVVSSLHSPAECCSCFDASGSLLGGASLETCVHNARTAAAGSCGPAVPEGDLERQHARTAMTRSSGLIVVLVSGAVPQRIAHCSAMCNMACRLAAGSALGQWPVHQHTRCCFLLSQQPAVTWRRTAVQRHLNTVRIRLIGCKWMQQGREGCNNCHCRSAAQCPVPVARDAGSLSEGPGEPAQELGPHGPQRQATSCRSSMGA